MECEYCHKTYSSVSSLNHHKKTNKKCLLLYQGETELTLHTVTCTYCDKKFMCPKTLKVHINVFCHVKKQEDQNIAIHQIQKKMEDEIIALKKQLRKKDNDLMKKDDDYKELAMKAVTEPRTVNHITTNYNDFLMPFQSMDDICKTIDEKFTVDHFSQGQRGVARDYLLTDSDSGKPTYYCTDTGRKKFVMKDKDGMIVKDCKSVNLTQMIVTGGIVTKSNRLYDGLLANINENQKVNKESSTSFNNKRIVCRKNLGEIHELETNNGKFTTALSTITCNPPRNEDEDEIEFEIEEEEEEETEEELKAKYTREYFEGKQEKINMFPPKNAIRRTSQKQLDLEKEKYRRFLDA